MRLWEKGEKVERRVEDNYIIVLYNGVLRIIFKDGGIRNRGLCIWFKVRKFINIVKL